MGGGGDSQGERTRRTSSQTPEPHTNLMDLKECLQDSPNFRLDLSERELEISDLEIKLEKVVQTCDRMVGSGLNFTDTCRVFSTSIKELSTHFEKTGIISVTLKRFYEALTELQTYYTILFDQAQRSVQTALRAFLSGELRKVKETKKAFHKVSDELSTAISRNAHMPRTKVQEAEEASTQLANTQTAYSHHAIDYAYQINTVTCIKGHEILDNLLSFMRAQFTFFHQGYEMLREFDPFMRQVAGEVDTLRKTAEASIGEMVSRHSLVTPQHLQDGTPDEPLRPMDNPALPIENVGYLFKRGKNAFKSWSRRWFLLRDNQLVYQSKAENKAEEYVSVAEDLRICTVKYAEDLERRFCFEVVTPNNSCMLQADSEALRRKWYLYLEAGIARALRISASNKKMEQLQDFRKRSETVSKGPAIQQLEESPRLRRRKDTATSNYSLGLDFLDAPGNDTCADCTSKKPKWASINLGIVLCIECSGIHRSLGVHISKVRSVTLDDWEPEIQKIMCALGNARVNGIFEYELPGHVKKPTSESSRAQRESFIRAKYVQHAFVHPHPNFDRPQIPLPVPKFPELLTPSRTPLQLSSVSPLSPHRRSFSPSLKIKPPKVRLPRPSSVQSHLNTSHEASNVSTPASADSDDERSSRGEPQPSGLALLAQNLKKMERTPGGGLAVKTKSWSNLKIGSKLKSARKSSKKFSNYALSRLSDAQSSFMRKARHGTKDKNVRETHSDIEDELESSSTPLLDKMSASSSNLTAIPPRKPPRTFKSRKSDFLCELGSHSDGAEEGEEGDLLAIRLPGEFSTDVLTAIKEMGEIYSQSKLESCNDSSTDDQTDGGVIANGKIPTGLTQSQSSDDLLLAPEIEIIKSMPKRPTSAPHLQKDAVGGETSSSPSPQNGKDDDVKSSESSESSESPDQPAFKILEPSDDDIGDISPEIEICIDEEDSDVQREGEVLLTPEMDDGSGSRSVPVRRKRMMTSPLPQLVVAILSSAVSDSDLSKSYPPPPPPPPPHTDHAKLFESSASTSKRFSMMSTNSADFFSAESSDGSDSKRNSLSLSPDLDLLAPASLDPTEGEEYLRVPSANSADDECFSTPPSSPPNIPLSGHERSPPQGVDHVIPEGKPTNQLSVSLEDSTGSKSLTDNFSSSTICPPEDQVIPGKEVTNQVAVLDPNSTDNSLSQNFSSDTICAEGDATDDKKLTNEIKDKDISSEDTLTPMATTNQVTVANYDQAKGKRKRSLTVSSSAQMLDLPLPPQHGQIFENVSKDDNFATEYQLLHNRRKQSEDNLSLISSFSQQDMADIFGERTIPGLGIETVPESPDENECEECDEGEGGEGGDGGGGGGGVGDGETAVEFPAAVNADVDGPQIASGSRPGTPEIIEPVIIPDPITPNMFLYNSALACDMPGVLCAIAHGASINFSNKEDDCRSAILLAIEAGSTVLVEFLYQNGAKLAAIDMQGRGVLHYAALNDDTSIVVMMMKRGAKCDVKDFDEKTPMDIALERESGDIVTMLRMAQFRAQQKADNRQSQCLEDLQSEYFRDIEVAQLVDPTRISRRSTASFDSLSTTSRDSVKEEHHS